MLNFSYKLCVGKQVPDIAFHNTPHFDEPDIDVGEYVLEVLPTYGPVIIHLIKVIMQKYEPLQEIIATSNSKKGVIQMMNPKVVSMLSSLDIVQDAQKNIETSGLYEDLTSSDKGIFLGCLINKTMSIVFNKHKKSLMESIKV